MGNEADEVRLSMQASTVESAFNNKHFDDKMMGCKSIVRQCVLENNTQAKYQPPDVE